MITKTWIEDLRGMAGLGWVTSRRAPDVAALMPITVRGPAAVATRARTRLMGADLAASAAAPTVQNGVICAAAPTACHG